MRKLLLFLTFALAFGAASVAGQNLISIDAVSNSYPTMGAGSVADVQLHAGQTHQIDLLFNVVDLGGGNGYLTSNSWDLWGTANWGIAQGTKGPITTSTLEGGTLSFLVVVYNNHWLKTGNTGSYGVAVDGGTAVDPLFDNSNATGIDTAGFQLAITSSPGIVPPNNGIGYSVEFSSDVYDDGETICFGMTTNSGAWEWAQLAGATVAPPWDNGFDAADGRCWTIYLIADEPPCFADDAVPYSFNHCDGASVPTMAIDPDGDGVSYSLVSGPGAVDAVTGEWTWAGPTVPQSGNAVAVIRATDDYSGPGGAQNSSTCGNGDLQINITVTNQDPVIGCALGSVTVGTGTTKTQLVTASDPDNCDGVTMSVTGFAVGETATVVEDLPANPGTYIVSYTPLPPARNVTLTIGADDPDVTTPAVTCGVDFTVSEGSLYQVEIEKVKDQIQGQYTDVFVKLHKADINDGIGGFDFLISYDASALSFQMATVGDVYGDPCNWEYFTYRYGANGNCDGGCPSGLLRIVGAAETNNGPAYADCIETNGIGHVLQADLPIILAEMRFLVSNDRTLECQMVPIRFFWMDCGDNAISNFDGSKLFLSEKVYEFFAYDDPFVGGEVFGQYAFPTAAGTIETLEFEECYFDENGKLAAANVGFQNGGIDIVCADSIDARGDINLNGLAYEIADAVMFTNYFIEGVSAFTHPDGSIAASDTNADGIALSVADLVYLIRVVVGDALPYAKTNPMAANFTFDNDVMNINAEMGAAYVVFEGNVNPTLLANNMDMQYRYDGTNTRVLVYSHEANQSFSGSFLEADGNVISTEFATFEGQTVSAKLIPVSFKVEQNYPNPFNPKTNIAFQIPNAGEWTLDIFNVTGQLVQSFSGVSETGFETVSWDASDRSSGIYFYRVTAGEFSATKKAVLLK